MTDLCIADHACRNYDRTTGLAGETLRHALCSACLDPAQAAVRALPLDWRDLEQLLPPALGVWGDGQPHGDGGNPIPLNAHVEALQSAIWWATTAWEEAVRDHARLSAVPRRRPGPIVHGWAVTPTGVVTPRRIERWRVEHPSALARPLRPGPSDIVRASKVLSVHIGALSDIGPTEMVDYPLEHIVGSPMGRQRGHDWMPPDPRWDTVTRYRGNTRTEVPGWLGVLDLAALHRRATAVLGLTKPIRRLPGECSGCGQPNLQQDQPRYKGDNPLVRCGGCERTWSYDEYARYAGLWEAAA